MEIWHRIGFSHKDQVESTIEVLGLSYKKKPLPGGAYILHLDIVESDPRWEQILTLVREKRGVDIYDTIFSGEEIVDAEWVRLIPTFERGYPQPQESWIDDHPNYRNICSKCGAGFVQSHSFQIEKEPQLGKHDFMTLYWTYALFATHRVFDILAEQGLSGFDRWEAIIQKTNKPSRTVSQIYIQHNAEPGLAATDQTKPEVCIQCGVTKYAFHKRGYMHLKRDSTLGGIDIQSTFEWFGSGGHNAFREILVSRRFAKLILDQGWQGVTLKPIKLI